MLFPCIFLVFFPSWPIEILFERGRFTANDSQMTAHALFAYSFGLPFYGMHKILLPVFYTINRQKTALVVAVVSILINIAFAIAMVPKYGFFVLAWSSTISIACHALLLYWLLPSKLFQKRNFFSSRQYVSFLALFFCLCGYFFALSEWLPQVSIAKIWWFFPLLVVPVGILDLFLWLSGGPVIFIRKIILKWKKTS
jgi:putative peptidoglycan lipid II flippase